MKTMTSTLAVALLAAATACNKSEQTEVTQADPAPLKTRHLDDSYVILTGTVNDPQPASFSLNYGEGMILVEMDDFDPQQEGRALEEGDRVTVYGFVDNDFYERSSIEAGSVYVEDLGAQFYASSFDEEDFPLASPAKPDPTISLTGWVTEVSGNHLTLRTKNQQLTVDMSTMTRNPTDRVGYQDITAGDRVHVTGYLTQGVFDGLEIEAENIVTLMGDMTSDTGI